jgi:hypothetical protein
VRLHRWWREAAAQYRVDTNLRSYVRLTLLWLLILSGVFWWTFHDQHSVKVVSKGQAFVCTPVSK